MQEGCIKVETSALPTAGLGMLLWGKISSDKDLNGDFDGLKCITWWKS